MKFKIDRKALGELIRKEREGMGLSQRELAGRIDAHYQAISSWELGKTEPSNDMMEKLCKSLYITGADLTRSILPLLEDEIYSLAHKRGF